MIAAIPVWNRRISPVFDTAERVLIARLEGGRIEDRTEALLIDLTPLEKIRLLKSSHVDLVICGGLSRLYSRLLLAERIEVIPWMSGDVEEILQAYCEGVLEPGDFRMPGCGRGRTGPRDGRGRGAGGTGPDGRRGAGMGGGKGSGMGGGKGSGMGGGRKSGNQRGGGRGGGGGRNW